MSDPTYLAYLLRLWRDHPEATWRATLQSPTNQESFSFATLDELFRFLQSQTAGSVELPSSLSSQTATDHEFD